VLEIAADTVAEAAPSVAASQALRSKKANPNPECEDAPPQEEEVLLEAGENLEEAPIEVAMSRLEVYNDDSVINIQQSDQKLEQFEKDCDAEPKEQSLLNDTMILE